MQANELRRVTDTYPQVPPPAGVLSAGGNSLHRGRIHAQGPGTPALQPHPSPHHEHPHRPAPGGKPESFGVTSQRDTHSKCHRASRRLGTPLRGCSAEAPSVCLSKHQDRHADTEPPPPSACSPHPVLSALNHIPGCKCHRFCAHACAQTDPPPLSNPTGSRPPEQGPADPPSAAGKGTNRVVGTWHHRCHSP